MERTTTADSSDSDEDEEENYDEEKIRSFFPESWIWKMFKLEYI